MSQTKNQFSCSSWNYGAYSYSNPYYAQQINKYNTYLKPSENKTGAMINRPQPKLTNFGKRILREEDKIVTNDYLRNINLLKKIEGKDLKNEGKFNKSKVKSTLHNDETYNNNDVSATQNNNSGNQKSKFNKSEEDYKFRLTFDEWCTVKDKQQAIFNKIKKLKEIEDQKMEKINRNVDKKYKEIKDQKYKEWLDNKNREIREKKRKKIEDEYIKEQEKIEKQKMKDIIMGEWFKRQAILIENEIKTKKTEEIQKKNEELAKKESEKERAKETHEVFKRWKEQKDMELREKKRNEMLMATVSKGNNRSNQSNFEKAITNGITIGPYTDAAELRKIQKLLAENYQEGEEVEEGEENDVNNNKGNLGENEGKQSGEENVGKSKGESVNAVAVEDDNAGESGVVANDGNKRVMDGDDAEEEGEENNLGEIDINSLNQEQAAIIQQIQQQLQAGNLPEDVELTEEQLLELQKLQQMQMQNLQQMSPEEQEEIAEVQEEEHEENNNEENQHNDDNEEDGGQQEIIEDEDDYDINGVRGNQSF